MEQDWTDDPVGWIEGKGAYLWSMQRTICAAVVANDKVAVRAGHGLGKSFLAARIACWWIDSHPPGTAFVLTTAPTHPQVRAILWREMNRAHRSGSLKGKMNQTEWIIDGEIVGIGRKPADHDEQGLQGIHAEYLLMILDEAGGIPKQLWDAAETVATGEGCKILAIGNPDDPSSYFRKVCELPNGGIGVGTSELGWEVLRIRAWDSPNVTGEVVPDALRRGLTALKWIEDKRKSWGVGSPLWQAKVEAEFPSDVADQVVSWSALLACARGDFDLPRDDARVLGVDVGGGRDETVAALRVGGEITQLWRAQTPEDWQAMDLVLLAAGEGRPEKINIDAIGVGWGLLTGLSDKLPVSCVVDGVKVSRSAKDPERFTMLRDELWWEARERCLARGWKLTGLDEADLQEFAAPKWSAVARGRIKVESKEETRKRIGRSPNAADAVMLAFYDDAVEYGEGGTWLEFLEPATTVVESVVPEGWRRRPEPAGLGWSGSGMFDSGS